MQQFNSAIIGKISLADIVGRAEFGGYELNKMAEQDNIDNTSYVLQFKMETSKGLSFDEVKVDFFDSESAHRDDRKFPVSLDGPELPLSSFDEPFVLLSPLNAIGDNAHRIVESIIRFSREEVYTFQHESFESEIVAASIIPTSEEKKEDEDTFLNCRERGMKSIVEYAVIAATRVNDDLPFISPVERNAIVKTARLPKNHDFSYGR